MSRCDMLTGLYNRQYMEESLERGLRRSMRKKSPLGVMMLDVDHFKRFNDTFCHDAGDSRPAGIGIPGSVNTQSGVRRTAFPK